MPSTTVKPRGHGRAAAMSVVAVAAACLTTAGLALAAPTTDGPVATDERPAAAAAAKPRAGHYIVVLDDQPAATYQGGVPGLSRTAPTAGEGLRADSEAVRRYRDHLTERQLDVAASVGVDPVYQYTVALNGFAAELSAAQANELARTPGVRAVVLDEAREPDTVTSPEFLGLSGDNGLWNTLGGVEQAGHGVVVGVIDSGIWPENPSFAGAELPAEPTGEVGQPYRTSDTATAMLKANGDPFTGECQPGEKWTTDLCNDKLISARYFAEGFVGNVDPEHYGEFEQISARDGDGHGSHTASIAAGNADVPMAVGDREFGAGSGMAPEAKLAVYKICWEDDADATGSCYTSDAVAAIDQAVADGVDIINYSISGADDTSTDPVELAFLSAASANVFVAVSAGNSGPTAGTAAHNSPWLTSVAASTHVAYEGTVTLDDGRRFRGSMISDVGVPEQTRLVYGRDIPAAGVDPAEAALCAPNSLNAADAAGAVVLCDRGVYDRVAKSAEAARAGAVGSVLGNVKEGESLSADFHTIPTVHVPAAAAAELREHAASPNATAALLVGDQTDQPPTPTPVIAGFSSRGPAVAHGGDLLKPDIAAPGVDVLAAVAPGPNDGNDFALISGTSMASPHIAGLAALIRGAEPEWSAMAVKSAIMTTAYDLKTADGTVSADPFAAGAGHVDPTAFLDPGLVYESTSDDWLAFLEGVGVDTGAHGVDPIDPSDLNVPSIAVGDLPGRQQITRRVTALTPGLYRADIDVPGFHATVTPAALHFSQPGQVKEFTVTLTRAEAALETYAIGSLTWSGDGVDVRSPVVAKPVTISAPAEVSGDWHDDEVSFEVTPGVTGDIDVSVRGLAPGEVTDGTLTPGEPADLAGNASSQAVEFEAPEGTTLARFDLVAGKADADFDITIHGPDGEALPVNGATGAASERVDLPDPVPGTYTVLVHMFASPDGGPVAFSLRNFAVGAEAAGNLEASPDPIPGRLGRPETVTVEHDDLERGVPYLAAVDYAGASAPTLISIE